MRRTRTALRHGTAALALLLAACAHAPPPLPPFEPWRQQHEAEVTRLEAHLAAHGVAAVLPLRELLRTASSWSDCHAPPFAVPPEGQWHAVVSVLRLLQALTAAGVLGEIQVHSGYRQPSLNACAGGAARSAHLLGFALDFTPLGPDDPTARLCRFWLAQGRAWNMGLSRYPSGRIHIDTAGYRTWGADHTGGSAACKAG